MYFAASLFVAFAITLYAVSKIAKMLNAKRPEINWIFFALLLGSLLALVAVTALGIFVQDQDPNIMLAITLVTALIVSSAAYKYINNLNWSGAFTLNVASMAIGALTLVTAIVINGESLNETLDTLNITAKKNTSIVKSMATGNQINNAKGLLNGSEASLSASIPASMSEDTLNTDTEESIENADDEMLEPVITELDLLPAGTVRDIKQREKNVYVEPKFRVVSLGNIHSAVGYRIRIYRENGNMVTGALKRVSGNDAVISRYTGKGMVIMPISIAKIHRLEVYK